MIRFKRLLLAGIFLLSSAAFAEDPPLGSLPLKIDFSQTTGFNDFYTSDKIRDSDTQYVRNIDYIKDGNLSTRGGFQEYSNSIVGVGTYHGNFLGVFVSTGSSRYLISQIDQNLSYFITDSPGPDSVFTPKFNHPVDGLNWNGYFYVISQDTVGVKLFEVGGTGVAFVYSTSVPSGQFAQAHIDRLLVAGSTNSPLTIQYSAADDADNFSPLNTIELTGVKEFDYITGLGPTLLGNLPIYTNNTVRLLTGTDFPDPGTAGNTQVRVVSDNIGCIHHRTIKNVNNRQYFYSKGSNQSNPGIYKFNGISVSEVTKSARHFFSTMNVSTFPIPNAYVFDDTYCLNVASASGIVNDYQICVDDQDRIMINQLGENPGSPPVFNAVDMVVPFANTVFAVSGQPYQGDLRKKIYKFTTDSSDYGPAPGTALNWRYKTKDFSMGQQVENRTKVAVRAYVTSKWNASAFTLTANRDFGKSSTTWTINSTTSYKNSAIETVLYSSVNVVNKITFPQNSKFNYINFDVAGSTYSSIKSIEFYAYPEPLR